MIGASSAHRLDMTAHEPVDPEDVAELLERAGFDPEHCVLTRRQAEVLALRERDVSQREIAATLGTSRANISSIEASARRNVRKARETVEVADALRPPLRIAIDDGTDLYAIPDLIYDACDEADTKVAHASAEIVQLVREGAGPAVADQTVVEPFRIRVAPDGSIAVDRQP